MLLSRVIVYSRETIALWPLYSRYWPAETRNDKGTRIASLVAIVVVFFATKVNEVHDGRD